MKYQAFISYSHQDGKLAAALQRGLTRFGKPWYRMRALRVFRDTTDLSVRPDLWEAISAALTDSEYLVLLASPEAASSKWVTREIETWLAHRKTAQQILLVVTNGAIAWDDATQDFDWRTTTAVPAALSRRFSREPLHLDLTWADRQGRLSAREPRFQDGVAALAATIHGRPKGEMIGEDIRQHRLVRRIAGATVAILAVLALGWTYSALRAQRNALDAEARGRLALSRQLAAESVAQLDASLDRALLLAVKATQIADTVQARGSLLAALSKNAFRPTFHRLTREDDTQLRQKIALAAFHPATHRIAVANWVGRLDLYDDGATLAPTLLLAQDGVRVPRALSFSPNGDFLATALSGQAFVCDVNALRCLAIAIGSKARAADVAFQPEGSLVIGRDDGAVEIVAAGGRSLAGAPQGAGFGVHRIAASVDGRYLVAGGADGQLALWEDRDGALVRRSIDGLDEAIDCLAFDGSGEKLAVGGQKGTVALWSTQTGRRIGAAVSGHDFVTALAFSPDGRRLASGGKDRQVRLWGADLRAPTTLAGLAEPVRQVAFSEDGDRVLALGHDGTLVTWDLLDGRTVLRAGGARVLAADFAPDGNTVTAVSKDGTTTTWNDRGHDVENRGDAVSLRAAVTSRNGRFTVVATLEDGGSPIALLENGAMARRTAIGSVNGNVTALAVNEDGTALAALTLDLEEGQRVAAVRGSVAHLWLGAERTPRQVELTGPSFGVALSPDGRTLVVGQTGGRISLWDTATGQVVATVVSPIEGWPVAFAVTTEGRLLAAAFADVPGLLLLDITDRTHPIEVARLATPVASAAVAFSPTGGLLATGSTDGRVSLWDVPTMERIGDLGGHARGITSLAFSADGTRLVSAGDDGAVIVWDASLESWRARACTIANRELTADEWRQFLPGKQRTPVCAGLAGGGTPAPPPRAASIGSGGVARDEAASEPAAAGSKAIDDGQRRPPLRTAKPAAEPPPSLPEALETVTGALAANRTGDPWVGFPRYPAARKLCAEVVFGSRGDVIRWHSFASADSAPQVASFYESRDAPSVEREAGAFRLRHGLRVLSVHAVGTQFPSCSSQPTAAEKTVIIVSEMEKH